MAKLEDKAAMGAKRFVLGFNAGCMACSDLARRIKEQVDHKLEVRSLRDPQAQEWRRRALGENAPHAPTLFEVEGPKVRAWTGWQMGIQLGRLLGPVASWRVMQALGEAGTASQAEESSATKVVGGLTRGQFLKGVGGAAVAMSVLSGTGKFARPAEAATITHTTQITGSELVNTARQRAGSKDMINLGGRVWSQGMQTGKVDNLCKRAHRKTACLTVIHHDPTAGNNSRWRADGSLFVDDGDTVVIAAKHTYSDGNTMTAVSYMQSNGRVMYSYKYDKQVRRGIRTEAALWKYDNTTDKFNRKNSSHNGVVDKRVPTATAQTQAVNAAAAPPDVCGGCTEYYSSDYGYYGYYTTTGEMISFLGSCVLKNFTYCSACEYLLLGGPAIGEVEAVLCVLALCPAFVATYCGYTGLVDKGYCISCYG